MSELFRPVKPRAIGEPLAPAAAPEPAASGQDNATWVKSAGSPSYSARPISSTMAPAAPAPLQPQIRSIAPGTAASPSSVAFRNPGAPEVAPLMRPAGDDSLKQAQGYYAREAKAASSAREAEIEAAQQAQAQQIDANNYEVSRRAARENRETVVNPTTGAKEFAFTDAEEAAKAAEKAQAEAEKAQQAKRNDSRERRFRQQGREFYTDSQGNIRPVDNREKFEADQAEAAKVKATKARNEETQSQLATESQLYEIDKESRPVHEKPDELKKEAGAAVDEAIYTALAAKDLDKATRARLQALADKAMERGEPMNRADLPDDLATAVGKHAPDQWSAAEERAAALATDQENRAWRASRESEIEKLRLKAINPAKWEARYGGGQESQVTGQEEAGQKGGYPEKKPAAESTTPEIAPLPEREASYRQRAGLHAEKVRVFNESQEAQARQWDNLLAENDAMVKTGVTADQLVPMTLGDEERLIHRDIVPRLQKLTERFIERGERDDAEVAGIEADANELRREAADLDRARELENREKDAQFNQYLDKLATDPDLAPAATRYRDASADYEARRAAVEEDLTLTPEQKKVAHLAIEGDRKAQFEAAQSEVEAGNAVKRKRIEGHSKLLELADNAMHAADGFEILFDGDKPSGDKPALTPETRAKLYERQVEIIGQIAQESGISPVEAARAVRSYQDAATEWSPGENIRKLSNGKMMVNPALTWDNERFAAAVEASGADEETKAATIASQAELKKLAVDPVIDGLRKTKSFSDYEEKQMMRPAGQRPRTEVEMVDRYMAERGKTQAFIDNADMIIRQGGNDVVAQFYGFGYGFGRNVLHLGKDWSEKYRPVLEDLGDPGGTFNAANADMSAALNAAQVPQLVQDVGRAAISMAPALAAGGVGAALRPVITSALIRGSTAGTIGRTFLGNMVGRGGFSAITAREAAQMASQAGLGGAGAGAFMQTFGSTYPEAVRAYQDSGMSFDEAADAAFLPAAGSATFTAAITMAFGKTGVESLLRGRAAGDVTAGELAAFLAKPGHRGQFLKAIKSKEFNEMAAKLAGTAGKDILGEAAEEGPDQLYSALVKLGTYEQDPDKTVSDAIGEGFHAALIGGILGGGAAGVQMAASDARRALSALSKQAPNGTTAGQVPAPVSSTPGQPSTPTTPSAQPSTPTPAPNAPAVAPVAPTTGQASPNAQPSTSAAPGAQPSTSPPAGTTSGAGPAPEATPARQPLPEQVAVSDAEIDAYSSQGRAGEQAKQQARTMRRVALGEAEQLSSTELGLLGLARGKTGKIGPRPLSKLEQDLGATSFAAMEGDNVVLTTEGLDYLAARFPQTRKMVQMDEPQARAYFRDKAAQEKAPATKAPTEAPAVPTIEDELEGAGFPKGEPIITPAPAVTEDERRAAREQDLATWAETERGLDAATAKRLAADHVARKGVTDPSWMIQALQDFGPEVNDAKAKAETKPETKPETSAQPATQTGPAETKPETKQEPASQTAPREKPPIVPADNKTAVEKLQAAFAAAVKRFAALGVDNIVEIDPEFAIDDGSIWVNQNNGRIEYNPARVEAIYGNRPNAAAELEQTIKHEFWHIATIQALIAKYGNLAKANEAMANVWTQFAKAYPQAAADIERVYEKGAFEKDPARGGWELSRMVMEFREDGTTTEMVTGAANSSRRARLQKVFQERFSERGGFKISKALRSLLEAITEFISGLPSVTRELRELSDAAAAIVKDGVVPVGTETQGAPRAGQVWEAKKSGKRYRIKEVTKDGQVWGTLESAPTSTTATSLGTAQGMAKNGRLVTVLKPAPRKSGKSGSDYDHHTTPLLNQLRETPIRSIAYFNGQRLNLFNRKRHGQPLNPAQKKTIQQINDYNDIPKVADYEGPMKPYLQGIFSMEGLPVDEVVSAMDRAGLIGTGDGTSKASDLGEAIHAEMKSLEARVVPIPATADQWTRRELNAKREMQDAGMWDWFEMVIDQVKFDWQISAMEELDEKTGQPTGKTEKGTAISKLLRRTAADLNEGDNIVVDKEELTVTKISDNGIVSLSNGKSGPSRFYETIITIEPGQVIYVSAHVDENGEAKITGQGSGATLKAGNPGQEGRFEAEQFELIDTPLSRPDAVAARKAEMDRMKIRAMQQRRLQGDDLVTQEDAFIDTRNEEGGQGLLFASNPNQLSFDFGISGDLGDRNQTAFDFSPAPGDTTQGNDRATRSRLERNSEDAGTRDGGGADRVPDEPRGTRDTGRPVDAAGTATGNATQGSLFGDDLLTALGGSLSDSGLRGDPPVDPQESAGDIDTGRGSELDGGRPSPESRGEESPSLDLAGSGDTGTLAPGGALDTGNILDIRRTAPALTPEQAGDVAFLEKRFSQHLGALLTNGTGTGKTFSGLGYVARLLEQGKRHILVVAPSDKVGSDWVAAAQEYFQINDARQLTDTRDNGGSARVVITTYANMGQNDSLGKRPWDAIIADEAHYLSQDKNGTETLALKAARALTMHPSGAIRYAEMQRPDLAATVKEVTAVEYRARTAEDQRRMTDASAILSDLATDYRARAEAMPRARRPKMLFLSATPFAYHFSLDYAAGYLYDLPKKAESRGYNEPSPRDQFYMENLGYRMRTNKLTSPENTVGVGILERRMAERFMKEGAMAGRVLDVPVDYGREFVLTETELGTRIDEILETMQKDPELSVLREKVALGNYLERRYLFESLKARESVERVKQHLALGRKVLVFHDYKKGGGVNPLPARVTGDILTVVDGRYRRVEYSDLLQQLIDKVPHYHETRQALDNLLAPIDLFQQAFGDKVGIFNGGVTKDRRKQIVKQFNAPDSGLDILLAQRASAKEGISLHDRNADRQRVMIDLGFPARPTDAIQGEGRIYRLGVQSPAIFEYLTTGTNTERWTFAQTIATRASTAENLAMGEKARSLLQAFADGYNDASARVPSLDQGTGGKERDAARNNPNPFADAVGLYYTNQKKTAANKSREGADYFATPEPLGYMMVEWGGVRPGEKILEPSAGHGAIARFFPDATNRHAVEPSFELMGRLALNATDLQIHQTTFEEYAVVNKFDVIMMNPPFGTAGKTAMEHVAKAVKHLRNGGRVVALIPEGSSMDKRLREWLDSDEAAGVYLMAEYGIPSVAFSRAGTNVKTRVIILDKTDNVDGLANPRARRDFDADNVEEFFAEIEGAGAPQRAEILREDAAEDIDGNPVQNQPSPAPVPMGRDTVFPTSATAEAPGRYSAADGWHAKKNIPTYVAKVEVRVERPEYEAALAKAKALGGYYSAFRGAGAIPGFQFSSAEARDQFLGQMGNPSPGTMLHASVPPSTLNSQPSTSPAPLLRTIAAMPAKPRAFVTALLAGDTVANAAKTAGYTTTDPEALAAGIGRRLLSQLTQQGVSAEQAREMVESEMGGGSQSIIPADPSLPTLSLADGRVLQGPGEFKLRAAIPGTQQPIAVDPRTKEIVPNPLYEQAEPSLYPRREGIMSALEAAYSPNETRAERLRNAMMDRKRRESEWVKKHDKGGVFLTAPEYIAAAPHNTGEYVIERAAVISPTPRKSGGWRRTGFHRITGPGYQYTDFKDGDWVPIAHDEHKDLAAAYEAVPGDKSAMRFTAKPLFAAIPDAYHGTPHKVDKFTTKQIGTGEGAQAYGYGLYFAESEGVAKNYMPSSPKNMLLDRFGNQVAVDPLKAQNIGAWGLLSESDSTGESLEELLTRKTSGLSERRAYLIEKDADLAREWIAKGYKVDRGGNLYTVRILADDETLLDWDKPLSEQSEVVRNALKGAYEFEQYFDAPIEVDEADTTGNYYWYYQGDTYDSKREALESGKLVGQLIPVDSKAAADRLLNLGIKGIRYLDGNSRSAGEGSYNYVIFDESDIEIIAENGKPVTMASAIRASTPQPLNSSTPPARAPGETLFDAAINRVTSTIGATDTVANLKDYLAAQYAKPFARPLHRFVDFLLKQAIPLQRLPQEVNALMQEMAIKQSFAQQKAMDVIRSVSGKAKFSDLAWPAKYVNDKGMRKRLFLAMQGKLAMSSLPPEVQAIATQLRARLNKAAIDAVRQGRMHPDTYRDMEQTYMPHYYYDHEKAAAGSLFARLKLGLGDMMAQRSTMWRIEDFETKDPFTGEDGALIAWDDKGKKVRFKNKQHRDAFYTDFLKERTVDEIHRRGKVAAFSAATKSQIDKLTAADLNRPDQLTDELRGYAKRVEQEMKARYHKGDPLTEEEQEQAGLIYDPVYAIAKHLATMEHDNATAEFFNTLATMPVYLGDEGVAGFTKLPDNRKLGRLAGKYVRDDVSEEVLALVNAPSDLARFYDGMLALWKTGKALALDTPIPTPSGWTTMGDLKAGDVIFDEEGKPCEVLMATGVQMNRTCYRVEFSDGTSIVADAEHLWATNAHGSRETKVVNTETIRDTLHYGTKKWNTHSITNTLPIETPEADLPIPPYVFGVWLGDGNCRHPQITVGEHDRDETIANIERDYGVFCGIPKVDTRTGAYTVRLFTDRCRTRKDSVQAKMIRMGVLGKEQKFIPDIYLRASIAQRTALLQGLMDSDGTISKTGGLELTTSYPPLRAGIMELLRSLGFKPAGNVKKTSAKDSFRIRFHADTGAPPFRLARKAARLRAAEPEKRARSNSRQITAVVPVESVPVKCIQVSSPNKLYLAGEGMIPTHNTVYNPGTHMRNVLGNLLFAQMAGVNPVTNAKYFKEGVQILLKGGPLLEELYQEGVLGGDFLTAELRQDLAAMLPEMTTDPGDDVWFKLAATVDRIVHRTGAKQAKRLIEAAYTMEDEMFKAAAYLKAKATGMTSKEAAAHVRKWFPYYDQIGTSSAIRAMRRGPMPFFSFQREALRILANAAKERPASLAFALAAPAILSAISAALLGLDDDDEKDIWKTAMRGKGKFFGRNTPMFSILLPNRSTEGRLQQFDLTNVMPFASLLGSRMEIDNGTPAWQQWALELITSSPITGIPLEMAFNTDTFSNRPIWEENMTPGEKRGAAAKYVWSQLMPPLAPGGTGWNMAANAGTRVSNKSLERRNTGQAWLRAVVGIDVRNASPNLYAMAEQFRTAEGLDQPDFAGYGTTPESRARARLFGELVQDAPSIDTLAKDLAFLKRQGRPIETEQDLNRLLFYRNPIMVIDGEDNQRKFRRSLSPEARAVLAEAESEFKRIQRTSGPILRRASVAARKITL